ncbi:MAG TPA: hypothetical protein DDW52_29520 [Planctomycetaceae bacterium]|nr:hypothetical protein [Planctomycetaceae bacterium]
MTEYCDPEYEIDSVDLLRVQTHIKRINDAARQVIASPIDQVLRKELNPYERCGAYILHSFNVLVENGMATEELMAQHATIVQSITELKLATLLAADEESDRRTR